MTRMSVGNVLARRGRGAEGKTPVLVAVETREKGAGFVAMKATISKETVKSFLVAQEEGKPAGKSW